MVSSNKNYWDKIANSYHQVSLVSRAHDNKFERIANFITSCKFGIILDAGCGSGILEKKLFDNGYSGKIYGIDSSKKMLEISRKHCSKATYYHQNLDKGIRRIKDSTVDCVVMINVFFLLRNPEFFLKEIRRVLTKEGVFILVNPKPRGEIKLFLKEQFKEKSALDIFVFFTKHVKKLVHLKRVISAQRKIDKVHKKGIHQYQEIHEVIRLLDLNGFKILETDEIQAKQNWLVISRSLND